MQIEPPYACLNFPKRRPGPRLPKFSLPVRLALLVAGTMLPLIFFAGGIVYRNYQQDREEAVARVLETARSIRIVLDAEVQRMTSGLEVLALTNAARQNDFDAFREIATKFLEQYPDGVLLVANRDGRQLFSSRVRDASTLPPRHNLDMVRKVFAIGKPAYSNLFLGVVRNAMIVTVEAPVFDNAGKVASVISFSPPIAIFQRIIEAQRPGPDWTISIFDGEGTNFARVPNPQDTVGKRASPTLYAQMFKATN